MNYRVRAKQHWPSDPDTLHILAILVTVISTEYKSREPGGFPGPWHNLFTGPLLSTDTTKISVEKELEERRIPAFDGDGED